MFRYIGAIEGEHQDIADDIRQFAPYPLQQRIVLQGVGGTGRYCPAQPVQEVVEVADVIVDLRRQQARLVGGALDSRGLVVLPLVPKPGPDQGREGNDRRKHQAEKLRSYAAKQHQPAPLSPNAEVEIPAHCPDYCVESFTIGIGTAARTCAPLVEQRATAADAGKTALTLNRCLSVSPLAFLLSL
jgi:hypothetical protein